MRECIFYNVTRQLLQDRLDMVLAGETPTETDMRHLSYETRNKFLRDNPQFMEPDNKASGVELYQNWGRIICVWCEKHAHQLDIDPTYWWRVRETLNIRAKPKAVCEGADRPFLVGRDTRKEVTARRSLILVCEKETVSRELLERFQQEEYRLNIVSTDGTTTSDVLEVIISEEIQSGLTERRRPRLKGMIEWLPIFNNRK